MRKLAPTPVSHRDDYLLSYRVDTLTTWFHIARIETPSWSGLWMSAHVLLVHWEASFMDLMPKWRPINYSFVCMFISPLSLIFTLKLFCFSYMLTRQRGLINMQTKESFIGRHFGIRSIRNETSFAWYCARFPWGMKSSLRCWNRGELEHVNELRVPIGNWGNLAMERELSRYHINTPNNLVPRTSPLAFGRVPEPGWWSSKSRPLSKIP